MLHQKATGESKDLGPLSGDNGATTVEAGRHQLRILDAKTGILYLGVLFVLGAIAAYYLFGLSFMLAFIGANRIVFFVALAAMCIIPLVFGAIVDKVHWLLGLTLGFALLFIGMPLALYPRYNSYIWFLGKDFEKGYIAIPVFLILGPVLAYAGRSFSKARRWRIPEFEHPYLSIAPLMVLIVVISILVPVFQEVNIGLGQTLKSEKYRFQVPVPAGWRVYESPITGEEEIENSIAKYNIDFAKFNSQYKSEGAMGDVSIRLYIFDRIPYTKEPLSSFKSEEALSDQVVSSLSKLYQTVYYKGTNYTLTNRESVQVDGKHAMSLMFEDFGAPETGYQADVYVYNSPYLYRLSFRLNCDLKQQHKIYNDFMKSFKFIQPE